VGITNPGGAPSQVANLQRAFFLFKTAQFREKLSKDILNFNWTQITQIYTDKKLFLKICVDPYFLRHLCPISFLKL
jgi:hypothetical protein